MSSEDQGTQGLLDGADALVEESDGLKRAWGEEAVPLRDRAARQEEALRTRRIEAVRAAQPRRFFVSPRALAVVGLCGLALALVGVGASALGGSGSATKTAAPSLGQVDSSKASTPATGRLVRQSKGRARPHRHRRMHHHLRRSRSAARRQAHPTSSASAPAPAPTPAAEPVAAPVSEPEAAPEPQASPPAPPPSQPTSSASAVSREFGFER